MRSASYQQLSALTGQLTEMCAMAGQAMRDATQALLQTDLRRADRVIAGQQDLAAVSADVEETAVALLAQPAPVTTDLRAVIRALQIHVHVERMGGLAMQVAKLVRRRHPQRVVPEEVTGYVADMGELADELAGGAGDVMLSQDPRRAAQIRHGDDAMDELHRQLLIVLIDRQWKHGVAAAVDVTRLGRFYKQFADHAVEIARRIILEASGRHKPRL